MLKNKLAHLLESPPAATNPIYMTWLSENYSVMTGSFNSLEEKISSSVMFLTITKEMWDTMKVMHENKNNL